MRAILLLAALLGGCAGATGKSFWDQEVIMTAWGITWATPYGPLNLGYISWQRNPEVPMKPARPPKIVVP